MRMLRLTIVLAAAIPLFAQSDVTLQRAIRKETVEGDLKGAIELYRKTVAEAGKDRNTGAQALLHLGQCYEKQGNAEARAVYERVVRDYADQKEAVATARARLGGNSTRQETGIVARQVWTGPKVGTYSAVSPDGRYLSFVDWETGDLALHDLSSAADRRLTRRAPESNPNEYGYAKESVFSPDGRRVAYAWFNGQDRDELRLISFGSSTAPAPRVLYTNEDVEAIAPSGWSPDGKWIAVQIARQDRTVQIGLVDSESGRLRVLKSGDWSGTGKLAFSPDGRFLAFDRPPSEDSEQADIYLLAVDGSREIPAVSHTAMDTVMGWTLDGNKLLFTSDRTGSMGIWALPVQDGKPQGAPNLVKSDVGYIFPMGLTRSGSLYFAIKVGGPDLYLASIDFNSGQVISPPVPATEQLIGSNRQPDWSPDGKYLVYSTFPAGPRAHFNKLSIQSIETGAIRVVRPKLNYLQWPRWSPDATAFLVQGTDLKGRTGIYRVDARNGNAELVVLTGRDSSLSPQWAPDGKRIYLVRTAPRDNSTEREVFVVERDLASGTERELFRRTVIAGQSLSVSPDGRYVSCIAVDSTGKYEVLVVVPVIGGEPRELLQLPFGGRFTAWSPDSHFLLFTKNASTNGDTGSEVWIVPSIGGQARKVELGLDGIRGLRVQPGGSKVAFFRSGTSPIQIWALENFLPTLSAKK